MKNKIIKMFSIICITLTSLSFVKADIVGDWRNPKLEIEKTNEPNNTYLYIIAGVIAVVVVVCFVLLNYFKNKKSVKK